MRHGSSLVLAVAPVPMSTEVNTHRVVPQHSTSLARPSSCFVLIARSGHLQFATGISQWYHTCTAVVFAYQVITVQVLTVAFNHVLKHRNRQRRVTVLLQSILSHSRNAKAASDTKTLYCCTVPLYPAASRQTLTHGTAREKERARITTHTRPRQAHLTVLLVEQYKHDTTMYYICHGIDKTIKRSYCCTDIYYISKRQKHMRHAATGRPSCATICACVIIDKVPWRERDSRSLFFSFHGFYFSLFCCFVTDLIQQSIQR